MMDTPRLAPVDTPLLLIDIDGVISLFGFDPWRPPPGRFALIDGIPHFLSGTAGELLRGLCDQYALVWCSGWEEKADEYLPAALGLPTGLPHLTFADAPGGSTRHWKLAAIDAYAGCDRALAWVDDAFDETCQTWASQRPGPALLVATEPAIGLTAGQADRLRAWAAELGRAQPVQDT